MEQAVHNMMLEPHVVKEIATLIIDFPSFIAHMAMFVKNEFDKGFFEQTQTENRYKAKVKTVEKTRLSSSLHDAGTSASPPTVKYDEENTNYQGYFDSRSTKYQQSSKNN